MPVDDTDLGALVKARRDGDNIALFALLKERFDAIVM